MRATVPTLPSLITTALLVLAVVLGVALRLDGPLSTDSLGAEDPYTHVVFTKEALDKGAFGDSVHLGTSMYPPGLHAFAGTVAPLAGVSLVDFARIAPPLLGALAVIGMFLLARRLGGDLAGLAAGFLTAIMPELVFRGELFFPTSFDLALVPAWMLAFVIAATPSDSAGDAPPWRSPTRVGAVALFLVLAVPFAFLHPWAVPLFAAPLGLYAALRVARLAPTVGHARQELMFSWAPLVLAIAFAMSSRWRQSDTGFADFFAHVAPLAPLARLELPPAALFVALFVLVGAAAAGGAWLLAALLPAVRRGRAKARQWAWATIGGLLVAAVIVLSLDLPKDVHYLHMLGGAAVVLALMGLVVALVRPTALSDLGAALGFILFPLTAFDVFGNPYWPQRTVAYLALGAVLLAAGAVVAFHERVSASASRRGMAAPVAVAVTFVVVGSAVAAAPGGGYDWYHLYSDEEFRAFDWTAELLAEDVDDRRVVVYSWQPGLILKALAEPSQVRYAPDFFRDDAKREQVLGESSDLTYVVVDRYLLEAVEKDKAGISFLDDSRFVERVQHGDGRFVLYEVVR